MELRQLRYFVKVAETLNFSEAARGLFVTQSTLSQQIKQLEDELGTVLFERDSHSVSLTENGNKLLPLARKTILDAKDCMDQIRDLKQMTTGELRIGVTYTFAPILTETVLNFNKAYPGVKLQIVGRNMIELMELLRKQEVDFVLAFKPNENFEEIESHALFDDNLAVILRKDHVLADRKSLTISELAGQGIAIPAKGLQARNALDRNVDIMKEGLNIRTEVNDANILLDIVECGQMVTILSESSIYHRDRLKAIPLDVPNNQMEGCVHVLKKAYRKRAAEMFVKMLSESNEVRARVNKWL